MKKITKMDIEQLCQSLETVSSMELSEFFGGGIHYYVNHRGEIEMYSGEQYVGYYIYCGRNSLEIGGPLEWAIQREYCGNVTLISNGSYAIFTFLANNTSVEFSYYCKTDDEKPVDNSNEGFITTTHDERDNLAGPPLGSDYNTQIHSHPRSDGYSGGDPSTEDRDRKKTQQEQENNSISIWGVYNPTTGKIIYY